MADARPRRLDPPVDPQRDHVLGAPEAPITLLEYGSYACPYCHAAHDIIVDLRDRFGERMRYVFRHLPIRDSDEAHQAARLAEYVGETTGDFWAIHDTLMRRGPTFAPEDFPAIAAEFAVPLEAASPAACAAADARVQEHIDSAQRSGARETPTFFINGRRYEGAWDQGALADAMVGSLGHRLQAATLDFARWAPSAGLSLLLMALVAVGLANSPLGPAFLAAWNTPFGLALGDAAFIMPLLDWINHGLLTVFFLVVGLEIKREVTVGRLASPRVAALPIAASLGGMTLPALIFLAVVPAGPLSAGWGVPIATDTAFAIGVIALLGERVPVELRVFLTAAVIVDDLAAIGILAVFYSEALHTGWLALSALIVVVLVSMNRSGIHRALPYGAFGVLLWICLHHAGLHATLAGVVLAMVTPTRPPANLRALQAQAEMVIREETRVGMQALHHGPSEDALHTLDVIHEQIESPASKLLRTMAPWSSYVVLPVFSLANAGVTWTPDVLAGNVRLMWGVALGLVLGKPLGIVLAAWLAVRTGLAVKPHEYSWRQLTGAGALAGIGFTMSLFIAGEAFGHGTHFAATKIAIFLASLIAGALGVALLWRRTAAQQAVPDAAAVR
ncbi:MAG: Na+/H+ antiporter NhaA [Proteobacteria bacterium]|nr:MAG: Na+/H+ antiporter NhaA [Pseudomonadota bacterium]